MPKVYGDRWQTVRSLGEGGQAHTYLVIDTKGDVDTQFVLKRLKNIKRLDRFEREIQAIADLEQHENVVKLIDSDLGAERPYLVTEYCAGGSLDGAEPFWQYSPVVALEIFEQICQGVAHAHANDVVHRDLKPANIFLRTERGPAVVGDFGICFVENDGQRLTLTEEAVGPRLYIAPELEDGKAELVSPLSDIYSLGKVLYWLLAGEVFSREKHRELDRDLRGWDPLRGRWKNIYMEHVNRLLNLMVVYDPDGRRQIDQVLLIVAEVKRLVAKEFNPIAEDIPTPPCLYCGKGVYQLRVTGSTEAQLFGLRAVGGSEWRILVCTACGHVQMFRIEEAEHKDDWWAPRASR